MTTIHHLIIILASFLRKSIF